jgi:hypothetical protein
MTRLSALLTAVLCASGAAAAACNANNCYRGIAGRGDAGKAFCSTYVAGPFTSPLPTYVSACSADPERITSACSCNGVISTSTSAAPAATETGSSSNPVTVINCPAESIGPQCQNVVNNFFQYGLCGWNRVRVGADPGAVVTRALDGSFEHYREGASMWVGREGISQPYGVCRYRGPCGQHMRVRTTAAEGCRFQACIWSSLQDSSRYMCMDNQSPQDRMTISAADGWRRLEGRIPPTEFAGETWTFSIWADNCELYVGEAWMGGCQP